jgi:hypothetical protein
MRVKIRACHLHVCRLPWVHAYETKLGLDSIVSQDKQNNNLKKKRLNNERIVAPNEPSCE